MTASALTSGFRPPAPPLTSVQTQQSASRSSLEERSLDEQRPAPGSSVDGQEPTEQSWVNQYYGQEPSESEVDEYRSSESVIHEQQSRPEVLVGEQEPPVDEEPRKDDGVDQPIRQINRTNVYQPPMTHVRFTPNPVGMRPWIDLARRPQTGAVEMPCKVTNGSLSTGLMCGAGSFLMAFGLIVAAVGGGHGAATVVDLALTIGGSVGLTAGGILCAVGTYKTIAWND